MSLSPSTVRCRLEIPSQVDPLPEAAQRSHAMLRMKRCFGERQVSLHEGISVRGTLLEEAMELLVHSGKKCSRRVNGLSPDMFHDLKPSHAR